MTMLVNKVVQYVRPDKANEKYYFTIPPFEGPNADYVTICF